MRPGISLMAAGLLSVATATCQPATQLPDEFLGRWYHQQTSGGIQGETVQEKVPGWIVITAENQIQHYAADGSLTSTEPFALSRGPTIFSEEDGWILDSLQGEATNDPLGISRAIWLEDDALAIGDNVYDGVGSTYTREP